ncbi:MAG TPA: ABC transporter permease, partial [Ilumatobacteraceae bacterium]|nr:ABC transporter permease [Ilumatobacteraceae bacterium]
DPARLQLGPAATDEALRGLRREMGLDQPMWKQYWIYMTDFIQGDWGRSFKFGQRVFPLMRSRFAASVELGITAFVLAFVGATAAAVLTTYRRNKPLEKVANGTAHIGLGTPPFWIGLILLLLVSQKLGIFPGPGRLDAEVAAPNKITGFYTIDFLLAGDIRGFLDAVHHLVLPAITLGLAPGAFLYRLFRANLLDVADSPFLLVARMKGVGRLRAFVRHAVPNAFLPTLTASGLLFGQMLGGSVLIEELFNWPGVGAAVTSGIRTQDFSVVQAFILISALMYVVISALIDVLYGVIDPRLRGQGSGR